LTPNRRFVAINTRAAKAVFGYLVGERPQQWRGTLLSEAATVVANPLGAPAPQDVAT
jgi:hypothetical protein